MNGWQNLYSAYHNNNFNQANRRYGGGNSGGNSGNGLNYRQNNHLQQQQPMSLIDMTIPPPPPPPVTFDCGGLRDFHHGTLVEMHGRVACLRMGRFIELRDMHGATQLVVQDPESTMGKRLSKMPLDSIISILGYVNLRPIKMRNNSIPTGAIEVHVKEILDVRVPERGARDLRKAQKRTFSTMTSRETFRGITSREYKRAKYENIIKYFENRKVTCGELRVDDVGKTVTLIGWLDPKKRGMFLEIQDGYGHTQIVNENANPEISYRISITSDDDIVVVTGRVMARPQSNIFTKSETGEIEVFIEDFRVLSPGDQYDGPLVTSAPKDIPTAMEPCEEPPAIVVPEKTNQPKVNEHTIRTHNCGELNETNIGEEVVMCGWLEFQRMRKFLTLRDAYGSTQIIMPEDLPNIADIDEAAFETILKVKGKVVARPPTMINDKLPTGAIEVMAKCIEILNNCRKNLPVEIREFNRSKEALRLEYRYLDLRFPDMQNNLRVRSDLLMKMREFMINRLGFVEVETPTLFRRTPGGAQEFVVPTRKSGYFYSLVQSPQQFKQMLMAGAIDRYFQVARCYRDEATRPERQPEFTQLDIELSFTNREHIIAMIEDLLVASLPPQCGLGVGGSISKPFERMTYTDAMEMYGSDKPDTRFDMKLQNLTAIVAKNESVSKDVNNFAAYAIVVKKPYSVLPTNLKNQFDKLKKEVKMSKLYVSRVKRSLPEWFSSGLGNLFTEAQSKEIAEHCGLDSEDLLLLGFGEKEEAQTLMGRVRLTMMKSLEARLLVPSLNTAGFKFLWVVDFPMFTRNEETKALESTHHPFTATHPDDLEAFNRNENLETIRSLAYDLVLNGSEIGGGSIRIHDPIVQRKVLDDILRIDYNHLTHLIEALGSGCPPHGGIALGIDRLVSIICGTSSIRDVIAFPKSIDGKDLLSRAPYEITDDEKRLYHIQVVKPGEKSSASDETTQIVEPVVSIEK